MRQIVLILLLILHLSLTLRASAELFDSTFPHNSKSVRIVFPAELKAHKTNLENWTLEALIAAETRLQLKLKEDIDVYFDSEPIDHNGLTTAVPRNLIVVHTEAPDLNSSVGVSRFYLLETLVHEWAHMLAISEYRGVFRGFTWIVGNTSRPNGAWPRWIHEGLAVWTEKNVGGRPHSGSIDFDLRRYAEFSQRKGRPALNSSLLDGQWELATFRPGQVPYTFGFLLFDHLEKNRSDFSVGRFAETSSSSLGISFRKTFEELDIDLDETFVKLQKEWEQTPIKTVKTSAELVSRAPDIRGLQTFNDTVSWVEFPDDAPVKLALSSGGKIVKDNWPLKLLSPLQASAIETGKGKNRWAVLVDGLPAWLENVFYSPLAPSRRRLVLFDAGESAPRCTFDLGDRLREVNIRPDRVLWIVSTTDGAFEMYSAKWNSECALSEQTLLMRSENFKRLSSPAPSGDSTIVTQNHFSRSIYDERIVSTDGSRLIGATTLLTQFTPAKNDLGIVFERSRDYWGPLVTRSLADSKTLEAFRIPLRTGAYEAVLSPDTEHVYFIEKLWDGDEILRLSTSDPSLVKSQTLRWEKAVASETAAVTVSKNTKEPSAHGPLDDIWPHFWIPSLLASDSGWLVAGQSFYTDLSKRWAGSTFLGYNTGTARPFGSQSLTWIPSSRKAWPQLDLLLEYDPRNVSYFGLPNQRVQERVSSSLSATLPFSLWSTYRGNASLAYSLRYYGKLGTFDEALQTGPVLRISLRSPYGRNPYSTLARLSDVPAFLYFEQRARWINAPEFQSDIYGLIHSGSRNRILLAGQAAQTDIKNFPQSYFIWGGSALLGASIEGNYLNRGFPVQGFVAKRLVRASTEWIWALWDPRVSLSWNRFRVQNLDLRLIAETLTWEDLFSANARIGKEFASSVGTELDILGSGLHYVSYKLSLGAFQGFGDYGETRYTAQLRVGLDL